MIIITIKVKKELYFSLSLSLSLLLLCNILVFQEYIHQSIYIFFLNLTSSSYYFVIEE